MAFSKVQLASNALILLGDSPISSFTEEGAGAVAASNLYESSYLAMLSSHRWNFATTKATLARLTGTPKNEYKYKFQLPADLVSLITTYPASNYKILGDKLYTDAATCDIDYIFKVTEDKFPAYFITAFEYYLASRLAVPVTEDLNKADMMVQLYDRESRKARYTDSQSTTNVPIQDDP